jgi:PAS domain S-box-containing protein
MLAGLGDVPVGARQTPPARIAWELEQVFLFSDAYFIYDKEIAGLREKVDSRIGEISDAISQAASASASDIATHIVDDSRQARLVSFWGLLVLGVMVLCLALLFRAHILKPILWSTDGLDIAEKEGRPVTLPQARMKELQAIADAVVRLSHVLSFQREANTDLETRVRERTAELEAAKLSLEMDIEARKKVEAALRESEERYRGLLGAWPDPTIVRDPEGVVTYVNDAFERTYGWRREEVLGKPLHAVMPEEEDLPSLPALQDLSEMVDSEPNETHRRTKDGHSLIVRINVAVLRDTLGKQVASLAIHRDVTRHVAMEAYIAQTQKMEAIGTLAGGIAHDFNNILTAVTGFTQYALSKTREPEVQEDLQAVLLSSKRATELVRQILTFSRQRPQQEAQPVQVKLLVKEGLNFLRASIPATIQMQQNIESESSVLANPSEIQRILVNLCTNAALAMGDEGGVLKVSLEDVELDAAFVANNWDVVPGRYLRLTVSDTGCGMTAEVKERIFEPFYTTRADGQGSGLGLSVVHGIVKARNGTVSVASEPGKGSTFEVYLPVVKQEGVADVEAYEASEPGTERILFVDDELTIVLMTEKMLGHLGYEVSGFTSSLKALEVFRSDPRAFDLVISDLTMPGLTGDVLAERIRALRPDIPVILCTGYDEKRMVEKAENLGIDEFVIKPVVGAQLTRLIRKVMDKS